MDTGYMSVCRQQIPHDPENVISCVLYHRLLLFASFSVSLSREIFHGTKSTLLEVIQRSIVKRRSEGLHGDPVSALHTPGYTTRMLGMSGEDHSWAVQASSSIL